MNKQCFWAVVLGWLLVLSPVVLAVTVELNSQIMEYGYQYLSPRPGAEYISLETQLIIRFTEADPNDMLSLTDFIQISGDQSGFHPGEARLASDGASILFYPATMFESGEGVTVILSPEFVVEPNVAPDSLTYRFFVSRSSATEAVLQTVVSEASSMVPTASVVSSQTTTFAQNTVGSATIQENGVAIPSDFPDMLITRNDSPDTGYIFINNRQIEPRYCVIYDNDGQAIWYRQTGKEEWHDFKVREVYGTQWLTAGVWNWAHNNGGEFIALDNHYEYVKSFRAANGYTTDEHEFQLQPDGGYLMIGRRPEWVNMQAYVPEGKTNASVRETVIQEFTANDELIFQWRAWDHFDIRNNSLDSPNKNVIRFSHMNAIEIDKDGHILLSSRHQDEITKIHRKTGEVIWRWNPRQDDSPYASSFRFVDDPLNGFYNQHDIRSLGNNHYTLFDNGNGRLPQESRGVEYVLDTNEMTATLVWEYRNGKFVPFKGNTQRLPNGNTLMNWVLRGYPKLLEVRPDGSKAFEMNFGRTDVRAEECYRVHRFPWQGKALRPDLFSETNRQGVTLLFNQFGDSRVDYYQIYAGYQPSPTEILKISEEPCTEITTEDLPSGGHYYFRVTSVDVNGVESAFSDEIQVVMPGDVVVPEGNYVDNGDFSAGLAHWTVDVQGGNATGEVTEGVCALRIMEGGTAYKAIQLKQNGIPMIKGIDYVLEFDAWAASPRIIEALVGQDQSPFTNYSRIGYTYVTPQRRHFRYTFTMNDPTDYNARVAINTGLDRADVFVDNIVIMAVSLP